MLEIFQGLDRTQYPVKQYAEFNYLKRSYLSTIEKVETYYHERNYAVKTNHLLCNILRHISVPMEYVPERYVSVASARIPYIASSFKLTSPISRGEVFKGVFYGPGVDEILLSIDDSFDIGFVTRNWKNVSAVTILSHPKSDLNLLLPNGKPMSSGSGVAIVGINIPMLALQYRCFTIEESLNNSGSDVSQFIQMYVLPNMIFQQTDIVFFNRLMNLYYGEPMGIANFRHAIQILHYEDKVDNVYRNVLDDLNNHVMSFPALLKNIPSLSNENMLQSLTIPDIAPTRQVFWAVVYSRLKIARFMVDISGRRSHALNRGYVNNYMRKIRTLNVLNAWEDILPEGVYKEALTDLDVLQGYL